jgi:hypothetical protein
MAYLNDLFSKPFTEELDGKSRRIEYTNVKEGSFGENALATAEFAYYENDVLKTEGMVAQFFVDDSYIVEVAYSCPPGTLSEYKSDMTRLFNSLEPR